MKPRRPWIAALLSLFVPGLGQLYAGEPRRAALVSLDGILLLLALLWSGLPRTFSGLLVLIVAVLALYLWAIWDAASVARRQRDYVPKPFNRWYLYLTAFVAAAFLGRGVLALSPVRAYNIPSGGMEPAVRIGDHVYADMTCYRSAKPARGDLALFTSPENPRVQLMKRVIGLEGEVIEIRDKAVYLDGKPLTDPWGHHSDPRLYSQGNASPMMIVRDNLAVQKIPPGTVFVLGDNRDNSYDSRYFGPIPLSSLQGRLLYVYWAVDKSRIGTRLR
jgi:signal peptidase I